VDIEEKRKRWRERSSARRAANPEKDKAYMREWRRNHPRDPLAESQRAQRERQEYRLLLIQALGGGCEVCKNTNPIVLEFDHRQGDGVEERKTSRTTTDRAYYLKCARDPDIKKRLACLCANCHKIKTHEADEKARAQRIYPRLDLLRDATRL
jgi:hypothetical protein